MKFRLSTPGRITTIAAAMLALIGAMAATQAHADSAREQMRQVEHPFILWTPEEAKALRQRIENDPQTKKQYERMSNSDITDRNPHMWNLFNYMVMGDEEAGQRELRHLLNFMDRKPEPMTWDRDPATLEWNEGMPSAGDRHQRDEQTLNVLRYDVLYHKLTEEQRKGIQKSFKAYIDFHLKGAPPRHPHFRYDRTSWLPNMHWPRVIGTKMMAVALRDYDLIKAMFESDGGWKFYFDDYLADERFYMEEFGKYYSNIGSKLMYCEALDRMNLNQFGYGYEGKRGATMKKHLEMMAWIGYPRFEPVRGGTGRIMGVAMGDAGDPNFVEPRDARGRGGSRWWSTAHMNGPLPKLGAPGWFEIGHKRWPDAGFDYFLAAMHMPGEDTYYPSLYWGLEPIDVKKTLARGGPPVVSYVAKDRGFALLRMEHSADYWESWRPAVSLQFARYYVHYVHDCFSLLQYVSHNRVIYDRMGRTQRGYAGNDAWRDHVRGHSGVVVDGLRARPVARVFDGTEGHRHRYQFDGPTRFTAVRAKEVYPDVDMERALFLTDEYLFDVYWLASDRSRVYDWQVLVVGSVTGTDSQPWKKAEQWTGERKIERLQLSDVHVMHPKADTWHATMLLPEANLEAPRGVGVRVHMLGEGDTFVLASRPPGMGANAPGASLLASREGESAVFAAVHAPFEKDQHKVQQVQRIQQTREAIATRITGAGVNDRIFYAWGDADAKPLTLGDNDDRATFTGHAFVRIHADKVEVVGNVQALRIKVAGNPKLTINGKDTSAQVRGGYLVFGNP